MKIEIRTLSIGSKSWVHEVTRPYEKKISHFNPCHLKMLKNEKDLLKGVEVKDLVLICDEGGQTMTSKEFAVQVGKFLDSGKQKLFIFVGGPFGFDDSVKQRADHSLALSSLVMNQEVALTVLLEQIFRAFTILNNHPYHNE